MRPTIKLITLTSFLLLAACGSDGTSTDITPEQLPSSGQVMNLPPQVVEPLTTPVVQVGVPEPVVQPELETEVVVVTPDPEPDPIVIVEPVPETQNEFRVDNWFVIFEQYDPTFVTQTIQDYTQEVVDTLEPRYFVSLVDGTTPELVMDENRFDSNDLLQPERIDGELFETLCGTSLFTGSKIFTGPSAFTYSFDQDFNFSDNCEDYTGGLRVVNSGGVVFIPNAPNSTAGISVLGSRTFSIGSDFEDISGNKLVGGYNVDDPKFPLECRGCASTTAQGGFSDVKIDDLCIANMNISRTISRTFDQAAPTVVNSTTSFEISVTTINNEFATFCDGTAVSREGSHTRIDMFTEQDSIFFSDSNFLGQINLLIQGNNGEQIRITDFADPNMMTEVLINNTDLVLSNISLVGSVANTFPSVRQ